MTQALLISDHYRCHNCGHDVDHTRRTRRFYLCDDCWAAIMPDWEQIEVRKGQRRDAAWYSETAEQRAKIAAYWEWYGKMEERYPALGDRFFHDPHWRAKQYASWGRGAKRERVSVPLLADDYYPLCQCGNRREELAFGSFPPGLFGGPFRSLCPVCDARKSVAVLVDMADKLHPGWDDEDWLDALSRSHPRLFELGVLPDAWFEVRGLDKT